ncbi:hypothetical protein SAMN05428975_3115 [Mucilaginibacter sp. OK268]|uniref:hypothetical protein n=1 Tax=Mucilaginibacter sp. OK268 TaxID=1881048 RepID=UPI000881C524|nr:hypothetical protein [Mucilaginibacter sp. OK268]SDP86263.1 hypothetical protein SAMN05428975_3115 [Mucilaginibacter sp. OK268]
MDFRQQLYYGILLRSIKAKFDHDAFTRLFSFNSDFILVKLLKSLLEAKPDNRIVYELHAEISQQGYNWFKGEIYQFISDKSFLLRKEIATASLMEDMIDMGFPCSEILDLVSKSCGNIKPLCIVE